MVRVKDLRNQTGSIGVRPFLWCPACGRKSSADASDYFAVSPETVFRCSGEHPVRSRGHRTRTMILATSREVIEEVSRGD